MKNTEKHVGQLKIQGSHGTQTILMEIGNEVYTPVEPANSRAKADGMKAESDFNVKLKRKATSLKPKRHRRSAACVALCNLPNYTENAKALAILFLLVLLSQVACFLVGLVPAMPVVHLDGVTLASVPVLRTLLQAIQGPEKWSGKGWQLHRPHIIQPQLSLRETRTSQSLQDYVGGTFKDYCGEKWKFFFPIICSSTVFIPEIPFPVMQGISRISPLALLIVFEHNKAVDARPSFELTATGLDSYNKKELKKLSKYADDCYWGFEKFLGWFCGKEKHIQQWKDDFDRFRPVTRRGHFTTPKSDNQTEWLCSGLSLFQQYLYYASEKADWISKEEAQEILLRFWCLVLPESAPSTEGRQAESQKNLTYESPETFYKFLSECFLPVYCNQVLHETKGVQGTMAIIRKLDNKDWFIAPRTQFLEAYARWLTEQHSSAFELGNEAAIQRQLMEIGVPLRGEKNNPSTWRYSFHKERRDKIDCLALPIESLPEWVQTVFGNLFGVPSDMASVPIKSELAPDYQEGAQLL